LKNYNLWALIILSCQKYYYLKKYVYVYAYMRIINILTYKATVRP